MLTMPAYTLHGVEVDFPFEAYPCQLDYMGKVIEALKGRKNALLESPTGTGKTLCLLCATLAWRAHQEKTLKEAFQQQQLPGPVPNMPKPPVPKYGPSYGGPSQGGPPGEPPGNSGPNVKHMLPAIIYSSRTHSQLIQVMKELKRTSYKVAGTVVGSRQQLCLHPTVSKLSSGAANAACKAVVAGGQCDWHHRFAGKDRNSTNAYLEKNPQTAEDILDIEELAKLGRSKRICPYFLSREMSSNADIVFMPYNYLLDARTRLGVSEGIKWNGAVLIFDEAHNVESVCADSASIEISAVQVGQALTEVNRAREHCVKRVSQDGGNAALVSLNPSAEPVLYKDLNDKFAMFMALLKNMEDNMAGWAKELPPSGKTAPGAELYTWLEKFNINESTLSMLQQAVEEAVNVLNDAESVDGLLGSNRSTAAGLLAITDLLNVAITAKKPMRPGGPPAHKGYRLHMQMERLEGGGMGRGRLRQEPVPKLCYWCFIPGIAMMELQNMDVHCMMLTSGTLSPLDSFAYELQIPFPIRLENPHVIQPSQIWVGVMSSGPSGQNLSSNYQNRNSEGYKRDLGLTIVNVARATPDGLLVFFPSYTVLDLCLEYWKNMGEPGCTLWDRICRYKQPVVEPRDTRLFPAAFKEFMDKLDDPTATGAVFFAVCRGKVSEGLDFSDRAARAVVITGIPFANKTDAKVTIKQQVLDEERAASRGVGGLSGDQWYVQQASRAVNQAIGRVIRHRNDFGAVVLADSRFGGTSNKNQLSKWLRDQVQTFPQFGPASASFTKFFKGKEHLTIAAREKALAAADNPIFQMVSGVGRAGGRNAARGFLDKNLVPAAMDVSGLPCVPRSLVVAATTINTTATTNNLLLMLDDAASTNNHHINYYNNKQHHHNNNHNSVNPSNITGLVSHRPGAGSAAVTSAAAAGSSTGMSAAASARATGMGRGASALAAGGGIGAQEGGAGNGVGGLQKENRQHIGLAYEPEGAAGGPKSRSKELMSDILSGLDGPAVKRQKTSSSLGGRMLQPLVAPPLKKQFARKFAHDALVPSNVIGPAHLVDEHRKRAALEADLAQPAAGQEVAGTWHDGTATNADGMNGDGHSGANMNRHDGMNRNGMDGMNGNGASMVQGMGQAQHGSRKVGPREAHKGPAAARVGRGAEAGLLAGQMDGLMGQAGGPRAVSALTAGTKPGVGNQGAARVTSGGSNPAGGAPARGRGEGESGGRETGSKEEDRAAFFARLRQELPNSQFSEFSNLLRQYKKSKDQHQFIEGLVALLKGPDTAHLLPQFDRHGIFKPELQDWFHHLIQPYVDASKVHMKADRPASSSHAQGPSTAPHNPTTPLSTSHPAGAPSTAPLSAAHATQLITSQRPVVEGTRQGGTSLRGPTGADMKAVPAGTNTKPVALAGMKASLEMAGKSVKLQPGGTGVMVGPFGGRAASGTGGVSGMWQEGTGQEGGNQHVGQQQARMQRGVNHAAVAAGKAVAAARKVAAQQQPPSGSLNNMSNAGGMGAGGAGSSKAGAGRGAHAGASRSGGVIGGGPRAGATSAAGARGRGANQAGATSLADGARESSKHSVQRVAKPRNQGCVVCGKPRCEPNAWEAKCGHLACYPCWQARLKSRPSCPACKQPASRAHLRMVPFA